VRGRFVGSSIRLLSLGTTSEHQLKTGNVGHSQVRDEPVDLLPVADWRNHKVGSALTGNAKRRRKKLVARAAHRKRKTPNFVVSHYSSVTISYD